jgi:hypothetical protein
MQNVAPGAKLVYVADLRIYGGEKEARIRNRTIADVAWTIIPSQSNAGIYFLSLPFAFACPFRWQEFHDTGYGVWGTIPNRPWWRAIYMVFVNQVKKMSEENIERNWIFTVDFDLLPAFQGDLGCHKRLSEKVARKICRGSKKTP